MRPPRPVTPHAILTAEIEALHDAMQAGAPADDLLNRIERCRALAKPLDAYITEISSTPSPALNALEEATREVGWDGAYEAGETTVLLEQEMVSGAVQGQLLRMLVAISGAQRILELGTFTGYAALAMAEALPADGRLIGVEHDPYTADFARRHLATSEAGQRVEVRTGDALEVIADLVSNGDPFDLVFLDADKDRYGLYFAALMDHDLVRLGGLICVDNTLYQGQVYATPPPSVNGAAVADFNATVAQDTRVEQVLIPLRDGLTLIRRVA